MHAYSGVAMVGPGRAWPYQRESYSILNLDPGGEREKATQHSELMCACAGLRIVCEYRKVHTYEYLLGGRQFTLFNATT